MKKIAICGLLVALVAVAGFSQQQPQKLEDVFKILDTNFKKYPYAHLITLNKYDDDRSPRNPIRQFQQLPYVTEAFTDESGNPMSGEIFYLIVIKNDYRYEMKIDFLPGKEKNAKDIKTVRGQVLRIVRDLDEAQMLVAAPATE